MNLYKTVIVFDTDCVLCSGWIGFVLRHERTPDAHFVSAWSEEGLALAAEHGMSAEDLDRTYLVVSEGSPLTKSDAAIAILAALRAPWSWVRFLSVVPRPIRDCMYDQVARNRYRWFGRRNQCFIPPSGQAHRFVSGPPRSEAAPDHR